MRRRQAGTHRHREGFICIETCKQVETDSGVGRLRHVGRETEIRDRDAHTLAQQSACAETGRKRNKGAVLPAKRYRHRSTPRDNVERQQCYRRQT